MIDMTSIKEHFMTSVIRTNMMCIRDQSIISISN